MYRSSKSKATVRVNLLSWNHGALQYAAATAVFVMLAVFTIFVDANKVYGSFLLLYQRCKTDQYLDIQKNPEMRAQHSCLLFEPMSTVVRNVMVYLPLAHMIITKNYSLYKHYASATATTTSSVIVLKKAISKTRPDHSNTESFPSGHAAMSFLGASFVLYAHGSIASIPWMVISSLNSASRVYCDKHTIADVIAGAVLSIASIFYSPKLLNYILVIAGRALKHLKQ